MPELLEKIIEYRFNNKYILKEALTHRSKLNESNTCDVSDNERFEFFGDAILSFLISLELVTRFPELREGELSKARASLVDELTLSYLAREMGLGRFLIMGRGEEVSGGQDRNSTLADTFEALVAAIYFDGGLEKAHSFVVSRFEALLTDIPLRDSNRDAKTELQELTQSLVGKTPRYCLKSSEGPDHARIFTAVVFVDDEELGEGRGKSKKEAEQGAARNGLLLLKSRVSAKS